MADFDPDLYRKLNPDIKKLLLKTEDCLPHYLNVGKKQNRRCALDVPNNFIWKEYVFIYDDLKKVIETEFDAKVHYTIFGKQERRHPCFKTPKDFDWQMYLFLNPDLQGAELTSEFDAKRHWTLDGYKEVERPYSFDFLPNDFNWKTYIKLNPKLGINNEWDAKVHYLQTGMRDAKLKYK